MHFRAARPCLAAFILALPAHAQTLADAKTCEGAIKGSAVSRTAVQRASTIAPRSGPALFAAGCLDVIASRWDSAAAHFDAAAKANPRSSAAQMWIGNITGQLARMGDQQTKVRLAPGIRDAYVRAITLDGTNIDAREALMQYLLEAAPQFGGDKGKAAEQASAIVRLNPYRGLSAQIAVASANADRASVERLLLQATTQFPDSVIGWANLSAMQADDSRAAEAFGTITRWQARGTNRMFALFSIGRTAAVSGQQLDRGAQALQQFLRGQRGPQDPPPANAHYRLAQIYEKQDKRNDAKAEYQLAVRLNPSLRAAQMALDRLK